MKAQSVRLLDVFVIGPIMVAAGMQKAQPQWMQLSLIAIGLGTIAYNGRNYLLIKQQAANEP